MTEAPGPKDAALSEQNEQQIIGFPEESDRNKDSQTGETRRAVLLVFIIYSYCTELGENQGGGYLKGPSRFFSNHCEEKTLPICLHAMSPFYPLINLFSHVFSLPKRHRFLLFCAFVSSSKQPIVSFLSSQDALPLYLISLIPLWATTPLSQ